MCDYNQAKLHFEKALETKSEFPKEEILFDYAKLEIEMKDFDAAKTILSTIREDNNSHMYNKYKELISLAIKQNNYEEAQKLFEILREKHTKYTFELVIIKNIISEALNNSSYSENESCYLIDQIVDYSDQKSIEHVIDHHIKNGDFTIDGNFEDFFYYTKKQLVEDNKIYTDLMDIYLIDYENIGTKANRYRVITVPNTKNIITMFPDKTQGFRRKKEYKDSLDQDKKYLEERKKKIYSRFQNSL